MKTINVYLDELKEKTGSDYKSAKLLDITRHTVSIIRKRQQLSDETAIRIADALGISRFEMLIAAAVARSEGLARETWMEIAKEAETNIHYAKFLKATCYFLSLHVFCNLWVMKWQGKGKAAYTRLELA